MKRTGELARAHGPDPMVLVAVTHERAPLSLLEQVSLDGEGAEAVERALLRHPGIAESVVLSTCNRTEIYVSGPGAESGGVLRSLSTRTGLPADMLARHAFVCDAANDVATHLLRVATGLESRLVGEVEVLAQVRGAVAASRAAGTAGPALTRLFELAIAAGRRAQRTTAQALRPSLPRIALDIARPAAPEAPGLTVVVGSGVMAARTVQELCARHRPYHVCARRPERAIRLAGSLERVSLLSALPHLLDEAETVICATGARSPLLSVIELEGAMSRRSGRLLTVIDLSIPRNVEPAAGGIEGLRLLDLDDLVVDTRTHQDRRREEIVASELQRYRSWAVDREAAPFVTALRRRIHEICRASVERSMVGAGVGTATIEATARSAANKVLHEPTMAIKSLIRDGDEAGARAILRDHGVDDIAIPKPGVVGDATRRRAS